MSPAAEPTVLTGDAYKVRLIGPLADVWPESPATPATLLQRDDMVAYPLPSSALPDSPDLVTGSWTGRMGDSGEATLTFPNAVASDGVPWRQRFDPTGHLQFVEVSYNDEIEYAGVIDQVPVVDQTQVQIHSSDGWWMLKKAYVRDWTVTQSPRDVIEYGTGLWVPVVADGFLAGTSFNTSLWTVSDPGGGSGESAVIQPSGGCLLTPATSGSAAVQITSTNVTTPPVKAWRLTVTIPNWQPSGRSFLSAEVISDGGAEVNQLLFFGNATLSVAGISPVTGNSVSAAQGQSVTLMMEFDGTWVWGFVNGYLVGCLRSATAGATELQVAVNASPEAVTIGEVVLEALEPFLQAGSDKGDYVLPGDQTTYPYGGLSARYFNDNDLSANTAAENLALVLAPTRTQAYNGSGAQEYMDQTDPQINGQSPPGFAASTPGPGSAAAAYWSCVWFGAIYLKLSGGDYTIGMTIPSSTFGFRLWIGKTQFGDQILDWWNLPTAGDFGATVSASALAGTLPYGGGTVARDGWYPIKIEYATFAANDAPTFSIIAPVSYVDPGGTSITGGTDYNVPSTSLSPLGCMDQRYQGIAHYDLVQQTVQAVGYQASVEPQQLESGLFPGVLAPRVREGHDTDVILQPDRAPRQDGENILNYSSGLDATDFASSLWGNGASIQNGGNGQLQATVHDVPTMLASLFDSQQWQDFSDASSGQLLQALLNSQLGLQLSPWQLLSADPSGRPRLAYTWPLPGELAKMRWRPGDGLLIRAADINVWDTSPRQMLTFTRNLLPLGIASSQASFAERPKTQARVLKQQLYKATRWARNYQRQLVQLTGTYVNGDIAASGTGAWSVVSLMSGDTVVQAWLRINQNSANMPLQIQINGTDFGSPLTVAVATVNVVSAASPVAPTARLIAAVVNTGGSTSDVDYQLLLTVLR